jgi:bifunctional non-homologous end joining protein LigD
VLSTRARPGATISMPIHWKDVKATLKSEQFDIRTGPVLLGKSKPWADYERSARSLSEAIENVVAQGQKRVTSKRS